MKKIICILMSVFIMGSASYAQENSTKSAKPVKKEAMPKTNTSRTNKAESSKANASEQTTTRVQPAKTNGKVKNDGTPDMRYKENKQTVKPVGKLKKNGTPDMRYKENKAAAQKK